MTSEREHVLREFQVGNPPDETHDAVGMADEIVRLRSALTTAKRERDEARRERDRERMERAAMEMMADDAVSERDKFASMLHDCENERDGWKHRAERAERVVEAVRVFFERTATIHGKTVGKQTILELARLYDALNAFDAAEAP